MDSDFVGDLEEIRLLPMAKNSDYLTAEHDNFCKSSLYELGETIDEAVLG